MGSGIEVRLLGPLEVAAGGGAVEFEGAKQRRLFVALALRAPEAVPDDALVEAVWASEAPDGREQALQKQVSRLRARLGEGLPVRRRAVGYALERCIARVATPRRSRSCARAAGSWSTSWGSSRARSCAAWRR